MQQICLTHSCERILPSEAFGVLYDIELIRYQHASSDVNTQTLGWTSRFQECSILFLSYQSVLTRELPRTALPSSIILMNDMNNISVARAQTITHNLNPAPPESRTKRSCDVDGLVVEFHTLRSLGIELQDLYVLLQPLLLNCLLPELGPSLLTLVWRHGKLCKWVMLGDECKEEMCRVGPLYPRIGYAFPHPPWAPSHQHSNTYHETSAYG